MTLITAYFICPKRDEKIQCVTSSLEKSGGNPPPETSAKKIEYYICQAPHACSIILGY